MPFEPSFFKLYRCIPFGLAFGCQLRRTAAHLSEILGIKSISISTVYLEIRVAETRERTTQRPL
jgi:hypothetical protein